MTPRSFARTPSISAEDVSEPPPSEVDSGDESLPPHTSEIGTLKKLSNSGTAWLGSSSGVYFVNTVRRAFSAALADTAANTIPASEDILTGDDDDGRNYNGPVIVGRTPMEGDFRRVVLSTLGRPPADRALAMELVTSFFRRWHPLFPFLHGPRFLQDIDEIYAMPDFTTTSTFTSIESRRVVTFQLIINIASLDRTDICLPTESRINSTSDVTRVAGCFSVNHDIAAIQLLIAAELYLVATISLRQASTVAGMILKLIYHAGLHRCPLRYASLSVEDCEIRRRIFWSAYALDRHLSLSLGDPNTVQDNDIDVCLSGRELHKAVAHELIINPTEELKMHLPTPQIGPHGSGLPSDDPRVVDLNEGPQAREKAQREAAMTAYVNYGKLTGRIIEIFHKSIHARFQKPEAITFLNSDIETWWNDIPSAFACDDDDNEDHIADKSQSNVSDLNNDQGQSGQPASSPSHKQLSPFFIILYHQLQLLLNRPRLSLDQSTAEFQHGLQICIKASRNTLSQLKKHRDNGQSMLLPGLLSATWMAGLIIAFACQLGKYPKSRAVTDISNCLGILESMSCSHWFTVKNCYKVLSLLLENIKGRKASVTGFLSPTVSQARAEAIVATAGGQAVPKKRMYDEVPGRFENEMASPKRKSMSMDHISPASSADFRMPPPPPNTGHTNPRTPGSSTPTASTTLNATATANTSSSNRQGGTVRSGSGSSKDYLGPNNNAHTGGSGGTTTTSTPPMPMTDPWSHSADNSPYTYPIMAPSTANIPTLITSTSTTSNPPAYDLNTNNANMSSSMGTGFPVPADTLTIDDPLFWGNFDYNISDIFGAASFESMTGGGAAGATSMGMGMGMGVGMGMGMGFGGGSGGRGSGVWDDSSSNNHHNNNNNSGAGTGS